MKFLPAPRGDGVGWGKTRRETGTALELGGGDGRDGLVMGC